MSSKDQETENRTSIWDEDPDHDYFIDHGPNERENEVRDIEIFDDTLSETVVALDPDRLVNLDRCPYCGTINKHNKDVCKHCGRERQWTSMHQFSGE